MNAGGHQRLDENVRPEGRVLKGYFRGRHPARENTLS